MSFPFKSKSQSSLNTVDSAAVVHQSATVYTCISVQVVPTSLSLNKTLLSHVQSFCNCIPGLSHGVPCKLILAFNQVHATFNANSGAAPKKFAFHVVEVIFMSPPVELRVPLSCISI